jgi:hypothetical protein
MAEIIYAWEYAYFFLISRFWIRHQIMRLKNCFQGKVITIARRRHSIYVLFSKRNILKQFLEEVDFNIFTIVVRLQFLH